MGYIRGCVRVVSELPEVTGNWGPPDQDCMVLVLIVIVIVLVLELD
jgi:hypothetical protein